MKRGIQMRKDALRRYMIYRMKLLELIHLFLLWGALNEGYVPENDMSHDGRDFSNSVRTAALSWFATIVDQSRDGMNVFDLWRLLFPKHRKEIDRAWKEIEPTWTYIRDFRDKAGFHADTPLNFFRVRSEIDKHQSEIIIAVQTFLGLSVKLLKKEDDELADLVPEVEECLLDLESVLGISLDRRWFRRALILRYDNYRKIFA